MEFKIKKSITYDMMDGSQLEYEFNGRDLNHITLKGNGKEPFSFNRVFVENLITTFEAMHDIYSDDYSIDACIGNCTIQLNVDPKGSSESFLMYIIKMK